VESFTPGGGATAAKGSGAFGVPHMLSSACNPGLEATAKAADNYRIFQLYVRGDDAFVDDHVRRARDHGYTIFCMTVDSANYSRRERDIDKRFVKPWRQSATGMNWQAALSWDQVKRFKDTHDIPLILKGIATAEDAAIACDHGVEGVYVSNHGGRQLDHGMGSLAVLPEVVRAVEVPSPGEDLKFHKFHRQKGGFLSVTLRREGNDSTIVFEHRDVHVVAGEHVRREANREPLEPGGVAVGGDRDDGLAAHRHRAEPVGDDPGQADALRDGVVQVDRHLVTRRVAVAERLIVVDVDLTDVFDDWLYRSTAQVDASGTAGVTSA